MTAKSLPLIVPLLAVLARPDPGSLSADALGRPTDAALLVDDAETLVRVEQRGFSFNEVVPRAMRDALLATVESDMTEMTAGQKPTSPRRPFRPTWLIRGRFELIGIVNRIDRRVLDDPAETGAACGEVRLVYRLALKNPERPITRLPMTVNVRIPQPSLPGSPPGDCRAVAARWARGADVIATLRSLPRFTKLEINFQSIHIPSTRMDMDDNAEYVQRTFRVADDTLVPEPLFGTPRPDLGAEEREALAAWTLANVDAIDEGRAIVPREFLATRSVSVSPRGLVHAKNRPFSSLVEGTARFRDAFADANGSAPPSPLARAKMVTTRELFLRRLDEMTCPGCHQTRGIAGFHMLGEERDARASFNALAVGHSPHLGAELAWRRRALADAAVGVAPSARPFSGHPEGVGGYGAECGIGRGFESWTCAPGLVCRDLHHADVGVCSPPTGTHPGDPCEAVETTPSSRIEGAIVKGMGADATCPAPTPKQGAAPFCAPNWLGFTGGMCSDRCKDVGAAGDSAICTSLPSSGYEAECFLIREPVETCLDRHYITARIATCDAAHLCRDDYACARVPNAPPGTGACIPPYFVFQLRVDGPILDR